MTSTIPRKRLEGVTATPELWSIYDECLATCQKGETKPLLTSVSTEDSECITSNTPLTSAPSLLTPLSPEEACTILSNFQKEQQKNKKPDAIPIAVIRAMKVVLANNDNALEQALSKTSLAFTSPKVLQPNADDPERKKFLARMERLRLQNEESKYYKITKNIGNQSVKDDGITTKSMTYAASVGLNMIVAPISFGVFMFFFSGPVLGFLWRNYEAPQHPGAVDIRKVIIGVISGVAMLFIEMLLFVIRTHELEREMTRKQKKKGTAIKPFGEYSSANKKTFTSEEVTTKKVE